MLRIGCTGMDARTYMVVTYKLLTLLDPSDDLF